MIYVEFSCSISVHQEIKNFKSIVTDCGVVYFIKLEIYNLYFFLLQNEYYFTLIVKYSVFF